MMPPAAGRRSKRRRRALRRNNGMMPRDLDATLGREEAPPPASRRARGGPRTPASLPARAWPPAPRIEPPRNLISFLREGGYSRGNLGGGFGGRERPEAGRVGRLAAAVWRPCGRDEGGRKACSLLQADCPTLCIRNRGPCRDRCHDPHHRGTRCFGFIPSCTTPSVRRWRHCR